MKQWIDMVEEDMKKRKVVQQDAGDREGWRRREVKGLVKPHKWGKFAGIINS